MRAIGLFVLIAQGVQIGDSASDCSANKENDVDYVVLDLAALVLWSLLPGTRCTPLTNGDALINLMSANTVSMIESHPFDAYATIDASCSVFFADFSL